MIKRPHYFNESTKVKRSTTSLPAQGYTIDKVMFHAESFQAQIDYLWTTEGAEKIFRNQSDFVIWLNSSNPGLGGVAPIQYIQSDIQKISDLLGRIMYGVLA